MQTGISTASLFLRKTTEDALEFLSKNKVACAEGFLESYWEYNAEFGKLLKEKNNEFYATLIEEEKVADLGYRFTKSQLKDGAKIKKGKKYYYV